MLSEIQKFGDTEVYSVVLPEEPEKTRNWFRATEISKFLGYSDTFRAVHSHCKNWQYREFQVGKGRPALYVCESGVYRLILRSKSQFALEFQDWLTEDVLPKLRADRFYIAPNATQQDLFRAQQHIQVLQLQQREILLGNYSDRVSVRAFIKAIALRVKADPALIGDKKVPSHRDLVHYFSWNLYEWQVDFGSNIQEMFDQYNLGDARQKLLFTSDSSAMFFADQKYPAWILAYFLVNNFLQNKLFAKYPKYWLFSFKEDFVQSLIPKLQPNSLELANTQH